MQIRKRSYLLDISFAQTSSKAVEQIHTQYGGSLYHFKQRSPKHKDNYCLHISGSNALTFLQDIYPFVQEKLPQVDIALDFIKHRGVNIRGNNKPSTPEALAIREAYYLALRQAKKEV